MAEFGPGVFDVSRKAKNDFTEDDRGRYIFVVGNGTKNEVVMATANNSISRTAVGVIQTDVKTDGHCTIRRTGRSKVIAGETLVPEELITYNTSGRAVNVASGDSAFVHGQVREGGDAGDLISADLFTPLRVTFP